MTGTGAEVDYGNVSSASIVITPPPTRWPPG